MKEFIFIWEGTEFLAWLQILSNLRPCCTMYILDSNCLSQKIMTMRFKKHRSLAFVPEGQVCVESRRDVCRPALTDIVYGVTRVSGSRSPRTRTSKTKRLALRRWRSSSDDLCASGEQVSPLSLTLLLQEKKIIIL